MGEIEEMDEVVKMEPVDEIRRWRNGGGRGYGGGKEIEEVEETEDVDKREGKMRW
jgi:hypothetical protein